MEKYTKHYVEIFCNTGAIRCEEIAERDPFLIKNDGFIHGFRFFDISYIEDDGLLYKSKEHSYSKNVYFGDRCSFEELTKRHRALFVDDYDKRPSASYCWFHNGSFIKLEDGDITYDELIESIDKIYKR